MTVMLRNAFAARLNQFVPLEESETHFLTKLQGSEKHCTKGCRLASHGDINDKVWILKSGWAVIRSQTRQRGSQILRVCLPGDFIGLTDCGTKHVCHEIVMQTDGVVIGLPRKDFHCDLTQFPRLKALLFSIDSLSQTAFLNQITCLKSMSAQCNLKLFLLQLHARSHAGHRGMGDRFEVPLSQVEIGQVLGLTSIYVNKLLRKFIAEGHLEIERPCFKLLSRAVWERETEFVDVFTDIDRAWFLNEPTHARKGQLQRPSPQVERRFPFISYVD